MADMNFSNDDMLALVKKSPAAVAAKDRAAWLSIFAAYNIVEDPVGSRPHISGVYDRRTGRRGNGPLARFFDTFIAPNDIVFDVERDIVTPYHVVRDLTIEISMSPEVRVKVPMHLLYVLGEQGGALRVFRLAAHWELIPMVRQALSFGLPSLKVMTLLGIRMLRLQGLGGVAGFCRGVINVGDDGRQCAQAFATAFNQGDSAGMAALFMPDAGGIAWPAPGSRMRAGELLASASGRLTYSKMLVAGRTVSVSCCWQDGGQSRPGVMIFEFNRRVQIDRVSAYWDRPQAASSSSASP